MRYQQMNGEAPRNRMPSQGDEMEANWLDRVLALPAKAREKAYGSGSTLLVLVGVGVLLYLVAGLRHDVQDTNEHLKTLIGYQELKGK